MTKPRVSIICCIGENLAIGKNNQLLWKIPEDLQHFKKITEGHAVIMGRKTFESIGKALPDRINIVVTKDPEFKKEGVLIAHSLEDALRLASLAQGDDELFIIGGGQVYKEAIFLADKLYLTIVEDSPEADTYFPDYSAFNKIVFEEKHQSGNLKFKYVELER